ncbi:MAG: 2-succinyl-5-enolpyruvyl-6-hydroxy-3-cyclohexene-1-carboxylic-acid synthase [Desulfotalea sp.]
MTEKKHISDLVHHSVAYGMNYLVISPGSRNAPLIRAFAASDKVKCISIVDERTAGFVALGISRQLNQPVGVVCTSGSAPLNYGPAIAEAYYQSLPLIVFTADRPSRLIDHQDSQTINQQEVFKNIVRMSVNLPEEPSDKASLQESARLVQQSFSVALAGNSGPVHINIPLAEPLYDNVLLEKEIILAGKESPTNTAISIDEGFVHSWNSASKKMIVCGQGDGETKKSLSYLVDDDSVVIIAENLANIVSEFYNPDAHVLSGKVTRKDLAPEILISFGGHVVSKHLKLLLREFPNIIHYRLDPDKKGIDTYQNINCELPYDATNFFKHFETKVKPSNNFNFKNSWRAALKGVTLPKDQEYQILNTLFEELPTNSIVHLGNSMSVRHSQKIASRDDLHYHGNRGVAGIDGSLSTAVGTAMVTDEIVLCVLGDLSFVYDSNGLWSKNLPANLRVVILNNQGGDIFNRIKGPSSSDGFEEFFLAHHPVDIGFLVKAYGASYMQCCPEEIMGLQKEFLSKKNRATVLEIKIKY